MIKIDDGREFFFQWDTDRYLTVTEDFQELHFSRAKFGKATTVKVEDGKVKVPNEMLMCSGELYVFGIVEKDGKFTKVEKIFIVEKRPKPENYDGKTTTQIEFEKVYDLIGNLEELNTEQKENLVSAINEIFEMAKNSAGGDSGSDEEMLDKKIDDLKVELIGSADDEASADTIKGAKQLALDLMNGLENRVVKTKELNDAINSALLQAKESGAFDGDDGLSAYQIWLSQGNTGSEADFLESLNGTSVTITSVTESTTDGGENIVTFSNGQTLKVKNGSKGSTPQKGVDYFTEADKTEIVSAVLSNFVNVGEVAL